MRDGVQRPGELLLCSDTGVCVFLVLHRFCIRRVFYLPAAGFCCSICFVVSCMFFNLASFLDLQHGWNVAVCPFQTPSFSEASCHKLKCWVRLTPTLVICHLLKVEFSLIFLENKCEKHLKKNNPLSLKIKVVLSSE